MNPVYTSSLSGMRVLGFIVTAITVIPGNKFLQEVSGTPPSPLPFLKPLRVGMEERKEDTMHWEGKEPLNAVI